MPWRRLGNPVVADDPMAGEAEPPTEDDPEQEAEDHTPIWTMELVVREHWRCQSLDH